MDVPVSRLGGSSLRFGGASHLGALRAHLDRQNALAAYAGKLGCRQNQIGTAGPRGMNCCNEIWLKTWGTPWQWKSPRSRPSDPLGFTDATLSTSDYGCCSMWSFSPIGNHLTRVLGAAVCRSGSTIYFGHLFDATQRRLGARKFGRAWGARQSFQHRVVGHSARE